MTDDELDRLLTPRAVGPLVPIDHEAIVQHSLTGLPQPVPMSPSRQTRWAWPLACGLLGLGIGWLAKPTPAPERIVETVVEKVVEKVIEPVIEPVPVPISPEPVVVRTPERLELEAEMATDRRVSAQRYREAGDAFLQASRIESAVRCYRQFLADAEADQQPATPDDSWLLSELKVARFPTRR